MVCEKTVLGCPLVVPLEPAGVVVDVVLGAERLREAELASMVRSGPEGRLEANGAKGRVGSDWNAVDMEDEGGHPREGEGQRESDWPVVGLSRTWDESPRMGTGWLAVGSWPGSCWGVAWCGVGRMERMKGDDRGKEKETEEKGRRKMEKENTHTFFACLLSFFLLSVLLFFFCSFSRGFSMVL